MKLAHVPAQERTDRAYLPRVLQTGDVHQPAAVVVHLNSTARANHLVGSLSHAARPRLGIGIRLCLRRLVQRNLLATVAQGLRHPEQFFQKLVDASDISLVQELAVGGKYFLHT